MRSSLMTASDLMHSGDALPLIDQNASMPDALAVMTDKGLGCVGVTDIKGVLAGMITDGDLRRHIGNNLRNRSAHEIMTKNPVTVSPDTLAADALRTMTAGQVKITQLFVLDGASSPVGLLHIHDLLRAGLK